MPDEQSEVENAQTVDVTCGSNSDSDSDRALPLTSQAATLFGLMDAQTRSRVVASFYGACFFLGSTLALLAFHYEFIAQTQRLPFDMRDWQITLIFGLLSLVAVGAATLAVKKK